MNFFSTHCRIGRQLARSASIPRAFAFAFACALLALCAKEAAYADPRFLDQGRDLIRVSDATGAPTSPPEALAEAPARLGLSLRAIVKQGGRSKAFIDQGGASGGLWVGEGSAIGGLTVLSIRQQSVVLQGEGSSYRLTLNYSGRGRAGGQEATQALPSPPFQQPPQRPANAPMRSSDLSGD